MTRNNFLLVLVPLFTVACDAAVTDAQEETCAGAKVKQQLVQARTKLHSEGRETEDIANPEEKEIKNNPNEEGAKSPKCPWHASEGLGCARGDMAVCADGERSWSCNLGGHGPRVQCPCTLPLMCAEAVCGGGADYCCERDCSKLGGLRPCEGEQEEAPTQEPTTPPEQRSPTPPPTPPLTWVAENPKEKLALCEGDCDNDKECTGNLKCFQRDGYTTPPGCDGLGKEAYDYCYDPEALGLPNLKDVGKNPGKTLDVCGGDCDSDKDCKEGLVCYQRSGSDTVPGCAGAGKKDWDYCIEGQTSYARELADKGVDPADSLELCTGDCDKDDDCAGNLKCFQRNGFTPVPGCFGTGAPDWDYCYDSKEPELKNVGVNPKEGEDGLLDVCAGDCDKDEECKAGLKCFQRSGFASVPGCLGKGEKDWDYCIE